MKTYSFIVMTIEMSVHMHEFFYMYTLFMCNVRMAPKLFCLESEAKRTSKKSIGVFLYYVKTSNTSIIDSTAPPTPNTHLVLPFDHSYLFLFEQQNDIKQEKFTYHATYEQICKKVHRWSDSCEADVDFTAWVRAFNRREYFNVFLRSHG